MGKRIPDEVRYVDTDLQIMVFEKGTNSRTEFYNDSKTFYSPKFILNVTIKVVIGGYKFSTRVFLFSSNHSS